MKTHLQNLFLTLALAVTCFFSQAKATTIFPIATNASVIEFCAGVASDGTNYLVCFSSGTNFSGTNFSAQLVSPNGTLIGSLITVGGGVYIPTLPQNAVVSGPTNYLVVWSDNSIGSGVDMFGQFISWSGAKTGQKFQLLQSQGTYGFQTVQAVAFDGTNYVVVWQDKNNGNIYGQLLTPAGTLSGSAFLISSQQQNKSSAGMFDGTNYFVVWETYNGSQGVYGAFVSKSGSVSSAFQINQTNSPTSSTQPPAVAFDGTNYLVVWNRDVSPGYPSAIIWNLYGRLVTPTGTLVGNEMALVTDFTLSPSLAFDGANYLLAYSYDTDNATNNSDKTLRYRFLDRSANLVGAEFTLFAPQGTNAPLFGGVIFDGTRFAVDADLGNIGVRSDGSITNIFSGDVYVTFIPKSTALPQLAVSSLPISGQFLLLLTGTPGINYAIQMATNLVSPNWTALVTDSPTNGTFNFTDTGATNKSRFYRAVKQ